MKPNQNPTEPQDLRHLKPGDWVYTLKRGWEKVVRSTEHSNFPIKLKGSSFTIEGKEYPNDKFPSVWTYNPFDQEEQPPVEFKAGEVIAVRDQPDDRWRYDRFERFDAGDNYPYTCSNENWILARKLTPEERGE